MNTGDADDTVPLALCVRASRLLGGTGLGQCCTTTHMGQVSQGVHQRASVKGQAWGEGEGGWAAAAMVLVLVLAAVRQPGYALAHLGQGLGQGMHWHALVKGHVWGEGEGGWAATAMVLVLVLVLVAIRQPRWASACLGQGPGMGVRVRTQALTCTTQVSSEQTMLLEELPHRQPVIALWFPGVSTWLLLSKAYILCTEWSCHMLWHLSHCGMLGLNSCFADYHPPMPQGKVVLEEVQWVVVCMAATMSVEDITMYTQISPRKVHGIISHFNTHCTVCTPAHAHAKVHHALSDDHINHLLQTLNSMPDLYLDELCIELEATMPYLYFKSLQ
ncbi:hypothetical protein BJV74DRAFT_800231 [Russula compacta]|nr:hypothetical protein BJV74DRAFT_800231 [Russula compacta]